PTRSRTNASLANSAKLSSEDARTPRALIELERLRKDFTPRTPCVRRGCRRSFASWSQGQFNARAIQGNLSALARRELHGDLLIRQSIAPGHPRREHDLRTHRPQVEYDLCVIALAVAQADSVVFVKAEGGTGSTASREH